MQKAGFYKTVYSALKHITFVDTMSFNIDHDDIKNGNVAELLKAEDRILFMKKVESSYGLYDSSIKNFFEVVPAKTRIDDLYFNKKACLDYQYFVDVEQVNNKYNRFILNVCEDNEIKLSIEIKDKRISGKYRVFFYLSDSNITVDIFDLIRREWLSSDELRHERQIKMGMNPTLPFNNDFNLYGVKTLNK